MGERPGHPNHQQAQDPGCKGGTRDKLLILILVRSYTIIFWFLYVFACHLFPETGVLSVTARMHCTDWSVSRVEATFPDLVPTLIGFREGLGQEPRGLFLSCAGPQRGCSGEGTVLGDGPLKSHTALPSSSSPRSPQGPSGVQREGQGTRRAGSCLSQETLTLYPLA